ncbi:MAG: hypothetical protein LBU56_03590 [Rickettsiales bacterium]|jgi:hypothetical protein|nr:hypothetical protein [Rickettsiales bacterium]
MRLLILAFLAMLCFACSQETEYVPCESGHGYLYKDGKEFVCPFSFNTIVRINDQLEWEDAGKKLKIIPKDASEYFPLRLFNSQSAYNISMKVPKKNFTEERYPILLQAVDKALKPCGESKETIFYKIAEYGDTIEYHTKLLTGKDPGRFIFFGEREMPSYDWYHVLKICNGNSFYIKGEVINE